MIKYRKWVRTASTTKIHVHKYHWVPSSLEINLKQLRFSISLRIGGRWGFALKKETTH